MKLSELRKVLEDLHNISPNIDPVVEMFYYTTGAYYSLDVDIEAIYNDPEGQLTIDGSIHLPLKEITVRGYVIIYSDPRRANRHDSIVIQAESVEHAKQLFNKHFSTYELINVVQEV